MTRTAGAQRSYQSSEASEMKRKKIIVLVCITYECKFGCPQLMSDNLATVGFGMVRITSYQPEPVFLGAGHESSSKSVAPRLCTCSQFLRSILCFNQNYAAARSGKPKQSHIYDVPASSSTTWPIRSAKRCRPNASAFARICERVRARVFPRDKINDAFDEK